MMEPSKLLDTLKSLASHWHIIFVSTSILLGAHFFAPSCILVSLGLDIIIDEYKPWISLLWAISFVCGLFHLWDKRHKRPDEQHDSKIEALQARSNLKKLCEAMLHDYRSRKNKAQELLGASFHFSVVPDVLQQWAHTSDKFNQLSNAINELPPVEFLKYTIKGDDSTVHTRFLLRDPYRNRKGDSRIGLRDVNVLAFRFLAVPKDKPQMPRLMMSEAEAMTLDIHFERIMEKWIMFLDAEGTSK